MCVWMYLQCLAVKSFTVPLKVESLSDKKRESREPKRRERERKKSNQIGNKRVDYLALMVH